MANSQKGRKRKMKILEEFWYGNIHPTERNIVSNSRVDKLLELVVKNEQTYSLSKNRQHFKNSETSKMNCPA